eukprot:symbB.v1.2.005964.t1/scaffold344.1/size224651/6
MAFNGRRRQPPPPPAERPSVPQQVDPSEGGPPSWCPGEPVPSAGIGAPPGLPTPNNPMMRAPTRQPTAVRGQNLEGVPVKVPLPQEARLDPRCQALLFMDTPAKVRPMKLMAREPQRGFLGQIDRATTLLSTIPR